MRTLYPEIEPVHSGLLDVGEGHQVYYEESGSREGLPVIFLHGGPGSGAKSHHRQFFDPKRYRIVVFDQRGTGRCQPFGRLEGNTTQHLLADMEAIREELSIDNWLVFGGSWGATLALLYAEHYPEHVRGLILRGTFLARSQDLNWMLGQGANRFFPEYWAEFTAQFESIRPDAIREALRQRLFNKDKAVQLSAAKAWALWTGRVVTYTLVEQYQLEIDDEQKLIDEARIEMHYASNHYFIRENQILDDIDRIPDVPVRIIHGRRDMTCTPSASWDVYCQIPQSELTILPDAGHLAGETPMCDALVRATDAMADRLQ